MVISEYRISKMTFEVLINYWVSMRLHHLKIDSHIINTNHHHVNYINNNHNNNYQLLTMNKTLFALFVISMTLFVACQDSDNSDSDTDDLENLINTDKACWLRSYGRGVGKPISTCPEGTEQNGALCYPLCQEGYYGVGPVCWQSCPAGFTDTGVDCLKPSSYGRGAGYALWHESECNHDNPQGCEKYGALYYPKCKDGFHNVGCCVCSPNCPSGWTDIGDIYKNMYQLCPTMANL